MSKSKYNAHTAPLFIEHGILPFDKLIKYGRLLFMHSVHFNYAPLSYQNVWQKNSERQGTLQLRNENLFELPFPRIDLFKRLTFYALPYKWNNSGNLMFYENRHTFRLALRDQLFQEVKDENNM